MVSDPPVSEAVSDLALPTLPGRAGEKETKRTSRASCVRFHTRFHTGFIPVSDLFEPPVGTLPRGGAPAMVGRSAGRGSSILWFQRWFHTLVSYPGFRGMKPRGFIGHAVGNSKKKEPISPSSPV